MLVVWAVLFSIALLVLVYPKKTVEITPEGWKKWHETGAVYTVIRYKKGILAGGVKGLWYSDGNKTVSFAKDILPKGVMVRSLRYSAERGLWVGHSRGLSVLYHQEWRHWSISEGMPKPPIQSIVFGKEKGWIAGENGIVTFNGIFPSGEIKRILPNDAFDIYRISTMLLDSHGTLWAGSSEAPRGGLFIIKEGNITLWDRSKGLPHPQVTSIMEDREGKIWVGTGFYDQGGAAVFIHNKQGWKIERRLLAKDLAGPKVRSIMQDDKGVYWIGSERHGMMLRKDNKVLAVLHREQGLPSKEVTRSLQMPDGSIWLATLKGLVHLQKEAVDKLRNPNMK